MPSPLAIVMPTLLVAVLHAQPANNQSRPPTRATLTPAGGGDADPLARGLANDTSSIDDGVGFGKVYELPRRPGQPRRFARISGATIAVFPYSTYVSTQDGDVATVPPGTTYYIGADWIRRLNTPFEIDAAPGLLAAPTAVNLSAASTVRTGTSQKPGENERRDVTPTPADTPRSIWTDESFRRERLARLLGP